MGFWDGLVKAAQGKPVFEVPESNGQKEQVTGQSSKPAVLKNDDNAKKIIPQIQLDHCKSRINGSEIEVIVWATNRSSVVIELDKITMLGATTELDRILSPNEGHEIRIFKGKVPTTDDDETARLQYKQIDNGDYFRADFILEFNYNSQNFYEIEDIRPILPVNDI